MLNVDRKQQRLCRQDINKLGSTLSVSDFELSNNEHISPTIIVTATPLNEYHRNEIEYKGRKMLFSLFARAIVIFVEFDAIHPVMDVGNIRFVCCWAVTLAPIITHNWNTILTKNAIRALWKWKISFIDRQ